MSKSQESNRKAIQKTKELQSKVESLRKESTGKLNESVKRRDSLQEKLSASRDQLGEFKKSYIIESCKSKGIKPEEILKSLTSKSTKEEIDKLISESVDKSERYRKMPVTQDNLIGLLESGTMKINSPQFKEDPELAQTLEFMDLYSHSK